MHCISLMAYADTGQIPDANTYLVRQGKGFVTSEEVQAQKGWPPGRVEDALDTLLKVSTLDVMAVSLQLTLHFTLAHACAFIDYKLDICR